MSPIAERVDLVAGHVARLILAQAGVVELLPAFHEAVGAAARIDAQFGFELESADGAVDLAASRLAGKFRVLLVGGFGVVRAIGPHLLEDLAGLLQFLHLLGTCLAAHAPASRRSHPRRGHGGRALGYARDAIPFRVFRHLPFRRFGFAPLGSRTAPFLSGASRSGLRPPSGPGTSSGERRPSNMLRTFSGTTLRTISATRSRKVIPRRSA